MQFPLGAESNSDVTGTKYSQGLHLRSTEVNGKAPVSTVRTGFDACRNISLLKVD